jgi:hypothetical protein
MSHEEELLVLEDYKFISELNNDIKNIIQKLRTLEHLNRVHNNEAVHFYERDEKVYWVDEAGLVKFGFFIKHNGRGIAVVQEVQTEQCFTGLSLKDANFRIEPVWKLKGNIINIECRLLYHFIDGKVFYCLNNTANLTA